MQSKYPRPTDAIAVMANLFLMSVFCGAVFLFAYAFAG